MTKSLAQAESSAPLVAFLGESQVGKSSLVNALVGARLLPTTGTGAPRSQAVCELYAPTPSIAEAQWRVSADWLPHTTIARIVSGDDLDRANLLRAGNAHADEAIFTRAFRAMNGNHGDPDLFAWAGRRDLSWLPLDTAVPTPHARRQLEALTASWPAALASRIRVRSDMSSSMCLVDLPGIGHADVGGRSTQAWLETHAPSVAAIVCVVGKRTPDILAGVLREYWAVDELRQRLHIVATFADHLVENVSNEQDRRRVAEARRVRAADHLRGLTDNLADEAPTLFRTFCLDPRPASRFWCNVDFDGELERLRRALAAVRTPAPRPGAAGVLRSGTMPRCAQTSAPQQATLSTSPAPMSLQPGEGIEHWMTRVVVPRLRNGVWKAELLRSGRRRLHLQATDSRGGTVTLVTIFGTGEAYLVVSSHKARLNPPKTESAGKALQTHVLDSARALGLAPPESRQFSHRSAR